MAIRTDPVVAIRAVFPAKAAKAAAPSRGSGRARDRWRSG